MEFESAVSAIGPAPSRFRVTASPVMIGLSMMNWLVLMLLMSGFILATTMSEHSEPAGNSAQISSTATP
jgi:hypothetical protein